MQSTVKFRHLKLTAKTEVQMAAYFAVLQHLKNCKTEAELIAESLLSKSDEIKQGEIGNKIIFMEIFLCLILNKCNNLLYEPSSLLFCISKIISGKFISRHRELSF